ncbi:hypothetical protein DFJ58DRAFT_732561 [Suillus subalutaceus]|uniref:uncharacterized protein n=1 Tax=Suillus subalutaceus TaxID=48586 RepID=UPI001B864793|nr:uncharacterized protein DFJ58DRAFT_732561 [Suillus subalutaceus]KAG1841109.1 hypothetical protein DFJ58DRAFT_732561 [Suillus subalutaceus]
MPQCPSCGKILKDHTSVARHMSQPWSGCNTWLEDIIKLNSLIPPLDPVNIEHDISHEPELGGEAMVVDFGDDGGEFGDEENIMGGGIMDEGGEVTEYYPDPPLAYQDGYTFLNLFDADENIAAWLLRSGLSMGKIDSFLSLEMIKELPLSFSSAKELRGRAEMLPSGPRWMSKVIPTSHATKSPVVLYWRDPLECIASIFNNPIFHNRIDSRPRKVYTTAEKRCRVYTEWMTGNDAWDMQAAIPSGATLLGTILSSDKTNITALTGDRVAHPLLISLANIHMNIRLKSSSSAFVLTALLPVPKFVHKKTQMKGVLEDRLIHECLDIVLEPLKQAARHGVMLSDPIGNSRYCFTPLASYIADTPEAMMLATVGGKTSPVTMAMYKQFGDAFQHEPRMKSTTLAQLTVVRSRADPLDIEAFFREAQKFRLNGVAEPFVRDWILAEPSHFFTPEDLHHIHKEFWDHDAQWLICAVGESEIDFRFSVLQPITGYQHFHGGISKLKQVTGRCHRDVQRYIIAVCVDAAPGVLTAVRALMQFRYRVQSPRIDDDDIRRIGRVSFKQGFNYRCGSSLREGLLDAKQTTEQLENINIDADADDADADADTPIELSAVQELPRRPVISYFAIARALQYRPLGSVPLPLRSFVVGRTAFHIAYDASIRKISIDDVAIKFSLPDLRPAIADFIQREATCGDQHIHAIGGPRRGAHTDILPFDRVQVWFKVRLQETEFHDAHTIRPAQTLNCAPPCHPWNLGRYDTAIVQTSAGFSWPSSGLSGHTVAQIRLIMRPIGKSGTSWSWKDQFLSYVQRFDISHDRDATTQLHVLKRSKRSNGVRMGDVIPLSQLRAPINLVPRFGATADKRLTVYNSMEHAAEFWLNEYWEKHTFFALSA